MTNPLRDALATGRFCYIVELVASALTREARLLEAASGLARIPAVVADFTADDGRPAGPKALRRLGQRANVDGAKPGVDRPVHVGQRQGRIAEHQQDVGAERRSREWQVARSVVEPDIAEDDDDGRDHQLLVDPE